VRHAHLRSYSTALRGSAIAGETIRPVPNFPLLANKDGAALVAARGETPFSSVDDLWRRAKVPVSSWPTRTRERVARPGASAGAVAIKALRDEPLELWMAAAEREARTVPELEEPDVAIRPMTAGGEVVEDYRHVGLSLRRHPVEFLRTDLAGRRIVTCADAMAARDGRWLEARPPDAGHLHS
jgi:error-prone DNA polymerase